MTDMVEDQDNLIGVDPKVQRRKIDQLSKHCEKLRDEDIQQLIDLAKSWGKADW